MAKRQGTQDDTERGPRKGGKGSGSISILGAPGRVGGARLTRPTGSPISQSRRWPVGQPGDQEQARTVTVGVDWRVWRGSAVQLGRQL